MYAPANGSARSAFSVFPFHTRPHRPPALGAVSSHARHVTEGHPGIGHRHGARRRKRQVIGQARVLGFADAAIRHAQAEETGVARREVGGKLLELKKLARGVSRSFGWFRPVEDRVTANTDRTRGSRSTPGVPPPLPFPSPKRTTFIERKNRTVGGSSTDDFGLRWPSKNWNGGSLWLMYYTPI